MQKMIKLSDTHYIIVDDSDIYLHDYFLAGKGIQQCMTSSEVDDLSVDNYAKKITHSTQPLVHPSCCISKEGITNMNKGCSERNGCLDNIQIIPLLEVEEAIYGYNVEKMAKDMYDNSLSSMAECAVGPNAYINGFRTHQELVKDKLFTIEDMNDAIDLARIDNCILSKTQVLNKLLPKREWDIEFDEQGKIKLI